MMEFGAEVRRMREDKGVSVRRLAARMFMHPSSLSRLERGLARPEMHHAKAADAALGTGRRFQDIFRLEGRKQAGFVEVEAVNETGGYLLAAPLSIPAVSAPGELSRPYDTKDDEDWQHSALDTADLINRVTRKDLAVNRRELGKVFATIFVGSPLLERLERFLLTPATPFPATGRASSVGYDEVAQIENTAQLFRDWDDQFGGGLRRKAVVGQLNEISDLLAEPHPPEIARRLYIAMAQLSETAATMSWDSGHGGAAQSYYLMGLQAARTGGDPAFAANVMAGMARQLLYLGRPGDALELIRLAQDTSAGRATASVRSMLCTREAWAYAHLGRVGAFLRATGRAEEALTEVLPEEDPHWIQYFDAAELHGTTGGRLLALSHHDKTHAVQAVDRIGAGIAARRPGRLRSSALDKIGLAESFIIQGELEEAARLGHSAIESAAQTASDRVKVQLLELFQRTESYEDVREIGDLRDRLKPLCFPNATIA